MTKRSIFRRIVDFFKRSPKVKLEKERRKVEKISNKLKQKQKMVESLDVEDKSKVKEKPRQSEFAENKELPPGIEPLGEDETIYDYQLEENSKRKSLKERALDDWKEYKKRHTLYETCYLIVETQEAIANPSNPNYKPPLRTIHWTFTEWKTTMTWSGFHILNVRPSIQFIQSTGVQSTLIFRYQGKRHTVSCWRKNNETPSNEFKKRYAIQESSTTFCQGKEKNAEGKGYKRNEEKPEIQ